MQSNGTPLGPGLNASLGYGFSLKLAKLIPEVGASYYYDSEILVPRAGARLQQVAEGRPCGEKNAGRT